ncbi:hypothetical protein HNP55_002002 [Paucibacter oligotrophus]|uniref:ABC-2 type transport system permease protein n=1 Tax=Roseateles oligotrophus TaxID=1769250 RepID=A0A840L9R2_9BURK|nr:hypothetical protein [Roseateles oligotrophus]MBB4843483.1 hypothetical protein [Roseateles oligotrophus]
MRLRGSATELRALLRRWWGFVVVVAALLGQFFSTLIGWPALPLFWALEQGPGLAAGLALLAHALPAILLCWALREQMLPRRWLQAEAALPLTRAQRRRADLAVLLLAQAPWILLNLASFLAWRLDSPAWMRGLWWGAGLGLGLSLLVSSAFGLLLMRAHRRGPLRPAAGQLTVFKSPGAGKSSPLGIWRALIWLPLRRGPAKPVLAAQIQAVLAALASLGLAWAWPLQASWALALYTLLVMGFCARLNGLALSCFEPLRRASLGLPLAEAAWAWRLQGLALLPAFVAWLALLLTLLAGPWALSPRAAPLFLLSGLVAPLLGVACSGGTAELRAGRWLLIWGVWVALASETLL